MIFILGITHVGIVCLAGFCFNVGLVIHISCLVGKQDALEEEKGSSIEPKAQDYIP